MKTPVLRMDEGIPPLRFSLFLLEGWLGFARIYSEIIDAVSSSAAPKCAYHAVVCMLLSAIEWFLLQLNAHLRYLLVSV